MNVDDTFLFSLISEITDGASGFTRQISLSPLDEAIDFLRIESDVVESDPGDPHLSRVAPIRQMNLLGFQVIDPSGMEVIVETAIFLQNFRRSSGRFGIRRTEK